MLTFIELIMQKENKKAGVVCCYKDCKNKAYNCKKKFYRFPKDVERAKLWLTACGRKDLLNKVDTLHRSHNMCDVHFTAPMFRRGKRQLLHKYAIPINFTSSSSTDEAIPNTSNSNTEHSQIPSTSILYQLLEKPASIGSSPFNAQATETSPISSPKRYVQTQTSKTLTHNTPRKERLRRMNKTLQLENKTLKRRNQILRRKCENLERKLRERLENIIIIASRNN